MAARHMTGTQFLSEIGFGADLVTPSSFPEYPPHNTKLQALEKSLPPGSPALNAAYQLLMHARQLHSQGNFAEEMKALNQADQVLDALMAGSSAGAAAKTLAAVVVVIVLGLLAYAYWPQIAAAGTGPRKNPKSKRSLPPWLKNRKARGARRAKAKARTQPKGDDDGEDDDDGDDDDGKDDRDDA